MSAVKISGDPPRRPVRQLLYIIAIVVVLAAAGVLLWLQLAYDDNKGPEELTEEVRKQIRRRARETSVKALHPGTP